MSVSFPVLGGPSGRDEDWQRTYTRDKLRRFNGAVEVRGVPCFVGFADVPRRGANPADREGVALARLRAAFDPDSMEKDGTEGLDLVPVPYGKVEFNPSRLLDPDGATLAPFDSVHGLVLEVLDAAGRLLEMGCDPADATVKRLDLAQDVSCGHGGIPFYLGGLSKVRPAWARERRLWQDPERNNAQSLWVGSGAGGVRLYDKHAEQPDKVPRGILRVEAECRADWAKSYGGVSHVRDIDGPGLEALLANRWRWAGVSTPVSATDLVLDRLLRSEHPALLNAKGEVSSAKLSRFLGDVILASRAIVPDMSTHRRADFRALVAELGIPVDDSGVIVSAGVDVPGGFVGHLDYDSGREIVEAA